MEILLILAVFIIILLTVSLLTVTYKNHTYIKELHKFDDAENWYILAFNDELTGIYNRNAYNRDVLEIENSTTKENCWIIIFDIDNFKNINDTKGHLEGDRVLRLIAKKLLSVFSSKEYTVYRIGGDEFSVIAKNISRKQLTDSLFKFREVFKAGGEVKVSMGYSVIENNVKSSFADADEMLYAVKTFKKREQESNKVNG
ncbi:MAG: GGDEF domain-containing protein [Clostridia bacterium]|nr:GGDEF domain-containing protein [Clostridia bacterium]